MSRIGGARQYIYNTNGTGRDSYVSINNGGLTVNQERNNHRIEQGSFAPSLPARRANREVPSNAKVPRYQLDGKGRDYFIFKNDGGFTGDYDSLNSS